MASLRRNFSFMVAGRAFYAVTQWLIIIVLARLSTPDLLGHFTYALAVTGPIIILSQLNMRAFMATDARDQFGFRDYLHTRLLLVIFGLTAICIFALGSGLSAIAAILIILVGLYKGIEAISDVFYGVMQKHEHMAPLARSVAIRGAAALAAITLAITMTESVVIGAAGIAVAWLALLVVHDIPHATRLLDTGEYRHQRPRVWAVVSTCFPMGIVLMLMSLRVNIPTYFIQHDLGSEQVGYYTAVAYFFAAGALVSGSLAQASSPRLARLLQSGNSQGFLALLTKLLGIALLAGVGGVFVAYFFGEIVLTVFYGSGYAQLEQLLVVVMVAASINYLAQLLGMSLTVARLLWFQLFSNGLAAIVVILCSYLLVPSLGIAGGGVALLCGAATALICNATVLVLKLYGMVSAGNRKFGV